MGLALALLCLFASWSYRQSVDPKFYDFGQYYMAALIVREAAWDSLYPIPDPESNDNAGGALDSWMTPRYAQLAADHGVGDVNRFIQPPPLALLLAPLAWLPFEQAHLLWLGLMTLAAGGLGLTAWRVYCLSGGKRPWAAAALVFCVVCSPLMLRTIRTGQISPAVAFCIGAALLALANRDDAKTALAVSLGGLAKYVTLILLPVLIIARRWRLLGWLAVFNVFAAGATLAVMGSGPFDVFMRDLFPTFSRPHSWQGNQSLSGFLMQIGGRETLGFAGTLVIRSVGFAVLLWLVWAIHRRSKADPDETRWLLPASCALISWFIVFSPIAWEHYQLYLCPFWGWLIYEAEKPTRWRIPILAALASSASSLAVVPGIQLPEPLLSHMLWSSIFFLSYSAYRLISPEGTHRAAAAD